MKVIVHGGAGSEPDEPAPRQDVLDDAAAAGTEKTDVIDAVLAAVNVLESSPRFNAGVGSAVQSDGIIRTDAGLMTSDRDAGAASSMPGVEHAIDVARVVMEDTPHVLVSGVHAVDLAADYGIDTEVDLWSKKTREKWEGLESHPEGSPKQHLEWLEDKFAGSGAERSSAKESSASNPRDHDTVGAVAFDGEEFAAATSTGGRWLALAGRVGDVPQIGSGFYAAPAGAASATGAGEDIAKTTLTRRAVHHLESGYDAQAAANRAIEEFAELTGSSAGVIVLDKDGNAGEAYNSDAMQTSTASE